jgi:hypothetical protein
VQASTAVLDRLRDMFASRTGHDVAEAAITLGVTPPSPVAWAISDRVHRGRSDLRWMPHPGGEMTALEWFPQPVQSVVVQILGDGELMDALRLQQDLTPRQRDALCDVLRPYLTAARAGSGSPDIQRQVRRAAAVVDYLWGEDR